MTLVASGELNIKGSAGDPTRSIQFEITGVATGGYSLSDAIAAKQGAVATSMSDFYGYTHIDYGRMYGEDAGGDANTSFLYRPSQGYYSIDPQSAETFKFKADQNESTSVYKDPSGTAFIASDNVAADLFRRTKLTGNAWGTAINSWGIGAYLSQAVACDFATYDYKWVMSDNI